MSMWNQFVSELRRLRRSGIIPLLLICYAILTAYVIQGTYFYSGHVWMNVINAVGDLKGFYPDPRDNILLPKELEPMLPAVAPLAHALFLPVITVAVIGWSQREGLYGGAGAVALARGERPFKIVVVRALAAAVFLMSAFFFYSLAYVAIMPAWFGVGIEGELWPAFFHRLLLAVVVCGSLAAAVSVIVTLFGGGGSVMAFLWLVVNLDYMAGELFTNIDVPLYIGCLGRICAPAPLYNGGGWVYTFSAIGFAFALLAGGLYIAMKTRTS